MVITDEKALQNFLSNSPTKAIDEVLNHLLPLGLNPNQFYGRESDTTRTKIEVNMAGNNDVYVFVSDHGNRNGVELQFCPEGRGESYMVRNALAILAYAIKKSNELRPQR